MEREKRTLLSQVCQERSKRRRERENFQSLCLSAAEEEKERRRSRESERERRESTQREEEEQLLENLDTASAQEDQLGVDFGGGEEGENERGNEEPQTDFPYSNINRIWNYLRKAGEHRLLELKNQVSANPCVFGAQLEKVPVRNNKEEMGIFLRKLVQLRDGFLSEEQLLATINRESGAKDFDFPPGCVPKGVKFHYCLKHGGEPVFSDKDYCLVCGGYQEDHPEEEVNSRSFPCLPGFKYNVGEGIANVLNNLGKEDRERFFENQKKAREQTFESFQSREHNIFDISSGLWYISALENGLAADIDLFLNVSLSVDGVEVRNSGSTFRKVYPVWIVLNDLPIELRFGKHPISLEPFKIRLSKEQNVRTWCLQPFSTTTTSPHSKTREIKRRKDTLPACLFLF